MASPILAGLTILMLGDSHFASQGYLITTLQDALIQQGAKVITEAACGASAGVWASAGQAPCGAAERIGSGPIKKDTANNAHVPSIDQLISTYHPGLVIIGTGDTMAGYAQPALPAEWIGEQIRDVIGRIQAANLPCVWIGPGWGMEGGPYFKTYARAQLLSNYLANHVAPCHYIDSLKFAKPGEWQAFDGEHYTLPAYQKWGLAIDQEILTLAKSK